MDFFVPIFACILFLLVKIIEMKFVEKEITSIKFMVRDTIVVFLVTTVSVFLYGTYFHSIHDFMNMVTNTKTIPVVIAPEIFTDSPGF
jgi:hypothetical protein|uniref:Uncharacterized protein n=1 Tax=viral metagenome TaxID=1070528 RepID=A0A6C0HVD2_9ZZZZ